MDTLSDQQITDLNRAQSRVDAGNPSPASDSNAGDIVNLEFAKTKGFEPIKQPVAQEQGQPVSTTPTVPVKIDVQPQIPTDVLSKPPVTANDISQQLISSQQKQQQQTKTFLSEMKGLQEQAIEATKPTEQETALISEISDITNQARRLRASFNAGIDKITGQSIPMSLAMGQSRELENQANRKLETLSTVQAPLIDTLKTLQSAREVKLTQFNILSKFARENFNLLQSDAQANSQLQAKIFEIQQEQQRFEREESRFALQFAVDNGVTSRFFKFPNDPTVYDLQQSGKPLSFEEYQQVTDQVGKAPEHTLFDNVQTLREDAPAGDFQFVKGTEDQEPGVFDPSTGAFIPLSPANATSTGIVTDGSGSSYDINSYATDPRHEASVQTILNRMGQLKSVEQMDSYIQQVAPGSPITGQMVANASEQFGTSWESMVAIMEQDSSLGTKGLGAKNFNPGNVGQFDRLGTQAVSGFGSWQEGVNAVGQNLSGRAVDTPEATQLHPEIQSSVELVTRGDLTPAQAIDKIDKKLRPALKTALADAPVSENPLVSTLRNKMGNIEDLINDKGLDNAVGPNRTARFSLFEKFNAKRGNFIAGIEQLISQETLDTLVAAKAQGATFGALSQTELDILIAAASKIGTWRVTKDGEKDGKVLGYKTTEEAFKKELQKIKDNSAGLIQSAGGSLLTQEERDEILGGQSTGEFSAESFFK